MDSKLLISQEGFIKTITFNQPKRRNAITNEMASQFRDEILNTQEDDSRVIIIKGAEGNFCAGADLDPSLLEGGGGFDVTAFLRATYNPLIIAMREMNKIFIAQVEGTCVGVGFNFALACDLIYSSENAKFSQIFTRIGLSSDGGGAYFLPHKVGYHKAFELMATNRIIDSQEALALGLVNGVVPDEEIGSHTTNMANRLASGPFLALQHTKANLRFGSTQGLAEALEAEAVHQGANFVSEDFFEGVMAFIQKRKANFKGK